VRVTANLVVGKLILSLNFEDYSAWYIAGVLLTVTVQFLAYCLNKPGGMTT
jgi:hypothetical protein